MKKNLTIIIVIVVLMSIAVAGYFLYKLNTEKKTNEINTITEENVVDKKNVLNEDTNIIDNNNQNEIQELAVDTEIVEKLYNYIRKISYYEEKTVYQDKRVEEKDLSNDLKVLTVFDNLDESESEKEEYFVDEMDKPHTFYTEEKVKEKAKEIFGKNVDIINEDVSIWPGESIKFKNGKYERFEYEGGGTIFWEKSFSALEKAKQDENNIYIYDKYVHLVENQEVKSDEGYNISGYYDIYTDSTRSKKLAEKVNFEQEGLYKNLDDNNKQMEDINNYVDNKLFTYKHTFKKAEDGSYYWYSTEPVI